jgi:hypothetical protein
MSTGKSKIPATKIIGLYLTNVNEFLTKRQLFPDIFTTLLTTSNKLYQP